MQVNQVNISQISKLKYQCNNYHQLTAALDIQRKHAGQTKLIWVYSKRFNKPAIIDKTKH